MATTQLQIRRGTTAQHSTFTGAQGELSYNTDTKRVHTHDGSTVSGNPLALKSELLLTITTVTATTYTLLLADQYVRSTNAGTSVIIVPPNSTAAFPIGTQITVVFGAGTGCSVASGAGVTITSADGMILRKIGSACTLTKTGTNTWDFAGDVRIS